jgi:hypothetical protein
MPSSSSRSVLHAFVGIARADIDPEGAGEVIVRVEDQGAAVAEVVEEREEAP